MLFDSSKLQSNVSDDASLMPDFTLLCLTRGEANEFMNANHSYNERMAFISKHHSFILDEVFKEENVIAYKFITQLENLDILTKVIAKINANISLAERNMCNKLVFDSVNYYKDKADFSKVKPYYMALAKAVNKDIINSLCIFCPEELACWIAICRHSSRSEDKNIKRINTLLIKQDERLITEQFIVDVFIKLFNHVSPLFSGIMKDVRDKEKMTESECEICGRIDLAILDIMNDMPSTEIYKVLAQYGEEFKLGYIKDVKFPIESISVYDYGRILNVVEQLKSEQVFLP